LATREPPPRANTYNGQRIKRFPKALRRPKPWNSQLQEYGSVEDAKAVIVFVEAKRVEHGATEEHPVTVENSSKPISSAYSSPRSRRNKGDGYTYIFLSK